jgi:hypothetical protein
VKIQTGKWRSNYFIADFVLQINGVWRVFDAKGKSMSWTKNQRFQVPIYEKQGGIAHKPGALPEAGMKLDPSRVVGVTPEMLQIGLQTIRDLLTK